MAKSWRKKCRKNQKQFKNKMVKTIKKKNGEYLKKNCLGNQKQF